MFPRRSYVLAAALVGAMACSGTSLNNSHPQISAAPTAVDFGTLPPGPPVFRDVMLTNTGTAPLTVVRAIVTADSSGAFSVENVPGRIAAGDSAPLTVRFVPPDGEGLYGGTLQITSNADNAPLLTLTLSGRISLAMDGGTSDAGSEDGGIDAGPEDGGVDAGPADAGPLDGGVDAGPEDGGVDAGPADAGTDAGSVDAGVCPSGLELCDGACTDTQHDPENCGICSHSCGSEQGCFAGNCGACNPTDGYTVLASNQSLPYDMVIDNTSAYWTAESGDAVVRVSLTGGTPSTIVSSSSLSPQNIAVDSTSVYFGSLTQDTVYKVGRFGGSLISIGSSMAWPSKIAVGPNGVFWLASTTGTVYKGSLIGGSVSTLAPAPSDNGNYELVGIDTDNVYFMKHSFDETNPGGIYKVSQSGGAVSTLATMLGLRDGAVGQDNIYWTGYSTVGMVPKSGGTPVTFAADLGNPRNMVVDDAYAYWSEGGTDGDLMACASGIRKISLNGGPVINVSYGQYSAWAVRVDADYIYWSDLYGGQIMKTPKP